MPRSSRSRTKPAARAWAAVLAFLMAGAQGVRGDDAEQPSVLEFLDNGLYSVLMAISPDGSVGVGYSGNPDQLGSYRAFHWDTTGGSVTTIGTVGRDASYATLVSADGSVVVGQAVGFNVVSRAFRWTAATGAQDLGELGRGSDFVWATGLSADGSVVVGWSNSLGCCVEPHAFRWTMSEGMADLGTLGGYDSFARAVSTDGAVVVGDSYTADGVVHAFRWTAAANAMADLGTLGGDNSYARFVSADGTVVVGQSDVIWGDASQSHAFRWTTATNAMADLGTLGGANSSARGVSADGAVVVGESDTGSGHLHAFRWTAATNAMADLGVLSGDVNSSAHAVSADGTVVVGHSWDAAATQHQVFRWSEPTGMQSVAQWLGGVGGLVPTGWQLAAPSNGLIWSGVTDGWYPVLVSSDGAVMAGTGLDPYGNAQSWIARLGPTPTPDGGAPIYGGGLIFLSNFDPTLADLRLAPYLASDVGALILHGSHHRTLMDSGLGPGDRCLWVTADAGRFDGSAANRFLGEVGGCVDFSGGQVRVGLGLGQARGSQDFAAGGDGDLEGQYGILEADYSATGEPWIASLTLLYGDWDTDLTRAYLNGAALDTSSGSPNAHTWAVRARLDWRDLAQVGALTLSPFLSYTHSRSHLDGYTETGGGFPARFDEQDQRWDEVRAGLIGKTRLGPATTLRVTVEGVQRFNESVSDLTGQVLGLYAYSFAGYSPNSTWGRGMLEIDQRFGNAVVSLSFNAATDGGDPSYGGSLSLKAAF